MAEETEKTMREAKRASEFGEDNTSFLWYPYLPRGDYTVMMADGGTGKTILCCGIAAAVSAGLKLPGEDEPCPPRSVLFISAEDKGEVLKKRLQLAGADLENCFILDCMDSEGMNIDTGFDEFAATVQAYNPALLIIDPWHGFLGERVDISRVNAVRPILHRLANLAKTCDCAVIAVSHVNKRAQGENANHAATGSTDFINAARSAFRVIFDDYDEDARICVHTKSNYAGYGRSIKYKVIDGGLTWAGFSEITKQTLEAAARGRATPGEILKRDNEQEETNTALIEAIENSANPFVPTKYTYEEFKSQHGEFIFGGKQPKRALECVRDRLSDDGFFLRTGIQVTKNKTKGNGFSIQKVDTYEPTQTQIGLT